MSSTYTGNPANGARSPAIAITVPADGDVGNVASVNVALDKLADQIAWLQAHIAALDLSNAFTAAQTIAALLTLSTSNVSLTAAALQSILKSGGKLQAGTSDANDLELLRAGAVMLALTSSGVDAKNSALINLARAQLQSLTADPTTPPEGTVWYRSDLDKLRALIGASTENLATESYVGVMADGSAGIGSFGSGWTNNSSRVHLSASGLVVMRIAATAGASPATGVCTLPVGYRPAGSGASDAVDCVAFDIGPSPPTLLPAIVQYSGAVAIHSPVANHAHRIHAVFRQGN